VGIGLAEEVVVLRTEEVLLSQTQLSPMSVDADGV